MLADALCVDQVAAHRPPVQPRLSDGRPQVGSARRLGQRPREPTSLPRTDPILQATVSRTRLRRKKGRLHLIYAIRI